MKKGDKLYVEGRIEYRQWQDKDGQTRYSTEINVRELIMLGGGSGAVAAATSTATRARARAPGRAEGQGDRPAVRRLRGFPERAADEDDDLPF